MIKGKIIDINADGSAIIQAPIDPYICEKRVPRKRNSR